MTQLDTVESRNTVDLQPKIQRKNKNMIKELPNRNKQPKKHSCIIVLKQRPLKRHGVISEDSTCYGSEGSYLTRQLILNPEQYSAMNIKMPQEILTKCIKI